MPTYTRRDVVEETDDRIVYAVEGFCDDGDPFDGFEQELKFTDPDIDGGWSSASTRSVWKPWTWRG